ncbi:pilus assembly protein PilW [Pseudoxanthomonas gei]|uniref:Pilus assembly protein PilW n=1 Tax=Pseudoxanthomonas gei TaxID=1383030 RepID=A0ABX0ACH1_9GAMM|nr:pilus assembly protein PilW [Pseudoxanthomonas gei]
MQGLSLIELMIALLIGLILLIGLVQVFGASRTAYQLSEGLARVQENGRFAMDYLQRDIRMAGHYGCVNDQARLQTNGALISHLAATDNPLNFAISIQGYEAANSAPTNTVNVAGATAGFTPALPAYLSNLNPAPRVGSDVLMLRYLGANGVPIIGVAGSQVTVDSGKWSVLTDEGVATPVLFGASDCSYTDVFQGSTVAPGTGVVTATANGLNTTATDFSGRYTASPAGQSMLYRANAVAYYVGVNNRGVPSLYRARFSSTAGSNAITNITEELVEGIENLQLLYGQDESTDVNSLSGNIGMQNTAAVVDPAGGVTNAASWRRVGQVQVGLLARSPDISSAPAPVDPRRALGVVYTVPADGRYRNSYEATIALRNRLYGQ